MTFPPPDVVNAFLVAFGIAIALGTILALLAAWRSAVDEIERVWHEVERLEAIRDKMDAKLAAIAHYAADDPKVDPDDEE